MSTPVYWCSQKCSWEQTTRGRKLAPALAWTGTVSDIAADITNEQQHVPTRSGHWSTVLKKHWGAQQISKSEVTQGSFSIVILWLLK